MNNEENNQLIKDLFKDKFLIRCVGEVDRKVDKTFTLLISTQIEYNPVACEDYRRIFGEDEFYKEIGKLLFGK